MAAVATALLRLEVQPAPAPAQTATGVLLFVVESFPNWPLPLLPQQRAVPSLSRAQVC
jgi:hypothetical protein